MSLATLKSRAQLGVDAPLVTIEVFLSGGLPKFSIVGFAETAVREAKDRVFGAIKNSGFEFPQRRITANLGPADMRKTGGRFDLAMALGILAASRQVKHADINRYEYYGELALSGELRPVPGVLPAAIKAARKKTPIIVPKASGAEASLAGGEVHVADNLLQVTALLGGLREPEFAHYVQAEDRPASGLDLADVRGQERARRALEIAAAGGHNMLLVGPPGTGKSMLARRLATILPPMPIDDAIETAAINSVLGIPLEPAALCRRPVRAPHHTASAAALVGGGADPMPGEISRAHNGVLFLDELAEFNRHVLEVLREPMETGRITISRASGQADYPARFQLIAAMNPCPCGFLGDPQGECNCSADAVQRYRGKISGPLLDRIDIKVDVPRPAASVLRPDAPPGESSEKVRIRVSTAQKRQQKRSGCLNAELDGAALSDVFGNDKGCFTLLENAANRARLSARGIRRVQRVALTIADLAGMTAVRVRDVAEALSLWRS